MVTYAREAPIETYFVRVAEAHGWEVRKLKWVGRRGAPDRLIMRDGGALVFVELKAPKGRVAPHQAREHERLRAKGQRVAVLWNKELVREYFE